MNCRHTLALFVIACATLCLMLGAVAAAAALREPAGPPGEALYFFGAIACAGAGLLAVGLWLYRRSEHDLRNVRRLPVLAPVSLVLYVLATLLLAVYAHQHGLDAGRDARILAGWGVLTLALGGAGLRRLLRQRGVLAAPEQERAGDQPPAPRRRPERN